MKKHGRPEFAVVLLAILFSGAAARCNTILVTNTNDTGAGSLRMAIGLASGTDGADTIRFEIPLTDPGYDAITGVWTITPASSYTVPKEITIDGRIATGGGAYRPGIEINGALIGPSGFTGLSLESKNALLGLIVNRFAYGIWIYGPDVSIAECYIGCDPTGSAARPNAIDGILLADGAAGAVIRDNLISGNRSDGIRLFGQQTSDVLIADNLIGIAAAGAGPLPNGDDGIRIQSGPHRIIIRGNVLSGNNWNGIELYGPECHHNTISGNRIGTDRTGLLAVPNGWDGLLISGGAHDNLIEHNQISGNMWNGIHFGLDGTTANRIQLNAIGCDSSRTAALPNQRYGIYLFKGASQNRVGPENLIAFNTLGGITVDGADSLDGAIGNTITANSLFANGGKGIETLRSGNSELEPPVILGITPTAITGTAGAGQIIEIFIDEQGQGKSYLGSSIAAPSGHFLLDLGGKPAPLSVVATATNDAGSTSAFSAPYGVDTGARATAESLPLYYELGQNYPNPFNSQTILEYRLGKEEHVTLIVYDRLGCEKERLVDEVLQPGTYRIPFFGAKLASGVYFYQLRAGAFSAVRRFLIVR